MVRLHLYRSSSSLIACAQIVMRFFATVHSFDVTPIEVQRSNNLKAWASPHIVHVDAALRRSKRPGTSPDIDALSRSASRSGSSCCDVSPPLSLSVRTSSASPPGTGVLYPATRVALRKEVVDEVTLDIYQLIAGKAKVLAPSFSTFGSPCRMSSLRANSSSTRQNSSASTGTENSAPGGEIKSGMSRSSLQRRLAKERDQAVTQPVAPKAEPVVELAGAYSSDDAVSTEQPIRAEAPAPAKVPSADPS